MYLIKCLGDRIINVFISLFIIFFLLPVSGDTHWAPIAGVQLKWANRSRGGGNTPPRGPRASKSSKRFPPNLNPGGRVGREWGYQVGNVLVLIRYIYFCTCIYYILIF